jgi:hypothetical protein
VIVFSTLAVVKVSIVRRGEEGVEESVIRDW